jgi:hypothetical protein
MDKENGETAERGEKSASGAVTGAGGGAPSDAASLLDAASLFGEFDDDNRLIPDYFPRSIRLLTLSGTNK